MDKWNVRCNLTKFLELLKSLRMVIGIISEGTEDQSVIKNILRGIAKMLDLDLETRPIRPDLRRDETDNHSNQQTIGTFQGVKNACQGENGEREDFDSFFFLDDHEFIVIQLDTAEIENQDFEFTRPVKDNNPNYSTELREGVIELINGWLENNYEGQLLYAITIEEMEAWCLTTYQKTNTTLSANPKNQLQRILSRRNIKIDGNNIARSFENNVSKDFRKFKNLKRYMQYNKSLEEFVLETINHFQEYTTE